MKILKDWDEITPAKIVIVLLIAASMISLLSGCVVYEGTYTSTSYYEEDGGELEYFKIHYAPIAGLYYYNNSPYCG